jgi:DNA-directed RNA polymerase subunit RPC12/RpoP
MDLGAKERAGKVSNRLRVCSLLVGVIGVVGSAAFSFTVDGSSASIGGGGIPEFALCLVLVAVAVLVLQALASILDLLGAGSAQPRSTTRPMLPERPLDPSAQDSYSLPPHMQPNFRCPKCGEHVYLPDGPTEEGGSTTHCPACGGASTSAEWSPRELLVEKRPDGTPAQMGDVRCPKCHSWQQDTFGASNVRACHFCNRETRALRWSTFASGQRP